MAEKLDNTGKRVRSRWTEVRALFRWWVQSWLRPAGSSLLSVQRAGRVARDDKDLSAESVHSSMGSGNSGPNRQQNIKQADTDTSTDTDTDTGAGT